MPREVDFLIVGGGLAGMTLAWKLLEREQSVLLLDREEMVTSSKIAAGLMTPITGKRFVKSTEWDASFPIAQGFYQDLETRLGQRFFFPTPMIRLFADRQERELYQTKVSQYGIDFAREPVPPLKRAEFHDQFGSFEMPSAARLDVAAYLSASRDAFLELGCYQRADLTLPGDVDLDGNRVTVSRLNVSASRLMLCQGFSADPNPWFQNLMFDATQGDILTVRIRGLTEQRIVHRGIWLVPLGDNLFRVGATHNRENLNTFPNEAGRAELGEKLAALVRLPFEVIEQQAAVRPILQGRQPLTMLHPDDPRIGIFNGLGSKGSLLAPVLADRFVERLLEFD